jgi:hypothetical protein
MNITTDNIEEWCFRYLEKDLDANEQAFFETELTSNKALQKEYALWKKTKIRDLVIDVPTHLNTPLLRYNAQFIWLCIELSVVITLSIASIYYRSTPTIVEHPMRTNTSVIIIDAADSIDTTEKKTQAKVLSELKHIERKSIIPTKEEIVLVIPSVQTYIDSSKHPRESANLEETILSTAISQPSIDLAIDSITLPKDSTVKNAAPKKIKATNRKRTTGSRLIPINNDL